VTAWLQRLGRRGLGFFERLGRGHIFLLRTLAAVPAVLARPRLLVAQLHAVGVLTLRPWSRRCSSPGARARR